MARVVPTPTSSHFWKERGGKDNGYLSKRRNKLVFYAQLVQLYQGEKKNKNEVEDKKKKKEEEKQEEEEQKKKKEEEEEE